MGVSIDLRLRNASPDRLPSLLAGITFLELVIVVPHDGAVGVGHNRALSTRPRRAGQVKIRPRPLCAVGAGVGQMRLVRDEELHPDQLGEKQYVRAAYRVGVGDGPAVLDENVLEDEGDALTLEHRLHAVGTAKLTHDGREPLHTAL
jgi:hypothetical protein